MYSFYLRYNVIVGSHSSKLCSLKVNSGKLNWSIQLGDRIECDVRINSRNTSGYVGCYDNYAYSIDLSSGKVNWMYRTGNIIKSTPCLSDDETALYVASYDHHLYCLKPDVSLLLFNFMNN